MTNEYQKALEHLEHSICDDKHDDHYEFVTDRYETIRKALSIMSRVESGEMALIETCKDDEASIQNSLAINGIAVTYEGMPAPKVED